RGGDTFKPDILAPGSASSTVPLWGERDHYNGTSMASPAAAGAIARLVDGLVRHEKKYPIDNALVLRAVKNTARPVPGLTLLDQGGGVLDLVAAYEYARFLAESGEAGVLREYRIQNRSPAAGFGALYWRHTPALPRPTDVLECLVSAGFSPKLSAEDKARFYRAFDLRPEVDWISLTKPMIYLKGDQPAPLGIMVDVADKAPGLYTARVGAYRKSDDRLDGAPIHEFDIPVTVLVPHRTTPDNRGRFRAAGEVAPGGFERVLFEVPPGIKAITLGLRMLEGGKASYLAAALYDPDGVGRGAAGPVSELVDRTEASHTLAGPEVVPGTWEVVVLSTLRSRTPASYDLQIQLSGVEFGTPTRFGPAGGPTRGQLLVPIRATQATHFRGTVKARFDRFVHRRVVEMQDTDVFTHTVRLDSATKNARWGVEFDRETWGLFTDCVLQVIDADTGKTLLNMGVSQRADAASVPVTVKDGAAKGFKVVLRPAFTRRADQKHWRFVFTEELAWGAPAAELEVVSPKNGSLHLAPNDWIHVVLRLPAMLPAPPDGYELGGELAAEAPRPEGVRIAVPLRL
ncbi:MAG: S8 family serine peptidase, partial [Planctomycetes bacterium]|nr:S8 family serine peptidase [Planctomycetota bacterium]